MNRHRKTVACNRKLDKSLDMDPSIWSRLPYDIIQKICNMVPKLRETNTELMAEIRFQPQKYAHWYYNTLSLFGFDNVYYVMYDDMRNILHVADTFPEDMPYERVVEEMWRGLTSEQRDEIVVHY